ncbi:sugar ABC transporter permease [Rhizobium sp. Root149]|uniref:Glucose/mannose transport system permease protein n=1 Tax=Rhizobium rhizoryzae TaxID=451876 RepID=A0A7W6PR53_9HYPH|nr:MULTISPECIES: carbohydrate ABC transporter permease [Rhizobium]KQZ48993.1 sugar ABC transporter permease [Rhizobium sp. Root149]MBB4144880.1 glucose/mannose transport system permease protein [Rhizobium rhizoryzae]
MTITNGPVLVRRNAFAAPLSRILVYVLLIAIAIAALVPLYVMIVTAFKSMEEIRSGTLLSLPHAFSFEHWHKAWNSACTGLRCEGLKVGFVNSFLITIPSVFLAIAVGAVTGYTLSFWRVRFANVLFTVMLIGGFFPYQVLIYPLVRITSTIGLFNSLAGVIFVHVVFALPVVTLLFRNYFASIPIDLFKAARIDGAGYWRIFFSILLPMSVPMIAVAGILQVTFIWNDYIVGLVFGGINYAPMTVQLNNIVHSTYGEREYNVEMAATLLTSVVPLLVYFTSGRWFVRGVASGAVKG